MFNSQKNKQHIYLVGIKGVGMTMLAQFLAAKGHYLSGSDIEDTFLTDTVLLDSKIPVFSPFAVKNIPLKIDLIIYSSAFNEQNNPELAVLKNDIKYASVPKLAYAEALGEVFNHHQGIAVCGSHGKTTVSAWLGYVLWKSGKKPSVLVGSRVPQFKGSSLSGRSDIFVAEVDEYQNKLQYFQPRGVVLNNIDYDHPDFFKTEADYVKVFVEFLKKIPRDGFLIMNNHDAHSRRIAKYCRGRVAKYDVDDAGYSGETVNYLAHNLRLKNGWQSFQVNDWGEFKIKLWGKHNIFNALAVIASARELGVSIADLKKYLYAFTGTERRAQILGDYKGALIIDDYAHHPTEIKTTLAGVKEHYPGRRLRVIFHPHTFTRTKALFSDFVESFPLADELIILGIYGSAREKQGGVSSAQLARAIKAFNRRHKISQNVGDLSDLKATTAYLRATVKKGDIILLLGAGDIFRVGEELLCYQKK